MHLRYCLQEAYSCGERGHAQKVMDKLGIRYQHATPQSMGDQWWFWNCYKLPPELPRFLSELKVHPRDMIGKGLSPILAEQIAAEMVALARLAPAGGGQA